MKIPSAQILGLICKPSLFNPLNAAVHASVTVSGQVHSLGVPAALLEFAPMYAAKYAFPVAISAVAVKELMNVEIDLIHAIDKVGTTAMLRVHWQDVVGI